MNKFIIYIFFSLIIFSISGCGNVDKEHIDIALSRGKNITKAVDLYYQANNKYPDSLLQLIPQYLKEIPKTGIGNFYFFYRLIPESAETVCLKGYLLAISIGGKFSFLDAKKGNYLIYYPTECYDSSKYKVVHEEIDGWASVTIYRRYGRSD